VKLKELEAALRRRVAAAEAAGAAAEAAAAALDGELAEIQQAETELRERAERVRARREALDTTSHLAAWEAATLDLEAVQRVLGLVGDESESAAPTVPAPAPAPAPAPVESDGEGAVSMSYPDMIAAVFGRNPASTKQWSMAELVQACAKHAGQPATALFEKRIRTAADRMAAKGVIVVKFSEARGKRVYSPN